MTFVDRCLEKAKAVLREIVEEGDAHPYKQIVGIWEIIEQLLRAIIYTYRKVTYEKPQKLISMLPRLVKKARSKELIAALQKAYAKRRSIVHRSNIPDKTGLETMKTEFCFVVQRLLDILGDKGYGADLLREEVELFCRGTYK